MSKLRPGTVDYSHFDNISFSSSESEEAESFMESDEETMDIDDEESFEDSDASSNESDDESIPTRPRRAPPVRRNIQAPAPRRTIPTPDLATLQRAWGIDGKAAAATSSNGNENVAADNNTPPIKVCAACSSPNPPFRCSRCRIAWYCDATCQQRYHAVHRLECIDASKHNMFWGVLVNENKGEESNTKAQLAARQMAKRRRALKRAAAAAAVARARLARAARGTETKGNAKKGQEKEEVCAVCQCEFTVSGDAGVSLCCPASHFMCFECSGVYVKSILGDLETSYPPRCPMCRADMPMEHFERQLTKQQQVEVKTFVAKKALKPGQKLVKCDECHYFEVTSGNPIIWWCDACGKGVCFVCCKELPRNAQKYDLATSPHAVCEALGSAKALVESAIEEGSKMKCPNCGLAGRKDDACTHMNCPKCTTVWCYVCGLDVKDCDKAAPREGRPVNDIFLHNQGWEVNEARCPMYLTQILEVDMHWLGDNWEETARDADFEDDEKCLDYFHRFQTIRKLQEVRETVGPNDFAAVFESFDSVKNSGYSLEEIISTSTDVLIDREEYLQYRREEAEEEVEAEGDDDDAAAQQDDSDDEVWEEVPEAMTRAIVMEQNQVAQAIEASRASAEEDGQVRQAMEESFEGTNTRNEE